MHIKAGVHFRITDQVGSHVGLVEPARSHSARTRKLAVVRPTTLDLLLTKMARGDENDLADIRFLLQQDAIFSEQIRAASARARVPDGPEIQELFRAPQPKMLAPAGAC